MEKASKDEPRLSAVNFGDKYIDFFIGNMVYRYNCNEKKMEPSFPKKIKDAYEGIPWDTIDGGIYSMKDRTKHLCWENLDNADYKKKGDLDAVLKKNPEAKIESLTFLKGSERIEYLFCGGELIEICYYPVSYYTKNICGKFSGGVVVPINNISGEKDVKNLYIYIENAYAYYSTYNAGISSGYKTNLLISDRYKIPFKTIDSIFQQGDHTYFFKKDECAIHNEKTWETIGPLKVFALWKGIPDIYNIHKKPAIHLRVQQDLDPPLPQEGLRFRMVNQRSLYLHIFLGTEYYRYNLVENKMESGYPKSIYDAWPVIGWNDFDGALYVALPPNSEIFGIRV